MELKLNQLNCDKKRRQNSLQLDATWALQAILINSKKEIAFNQLCKKKASAHYIFSQKFKFTYNLDHHINLKSS
jgi:hypothetical protein